MAKKKYKSSKSIEDKLYLIDKYAKANPDIPLGPIRYAILNDVSTPEFSVINNNVYANPFLAKQIENAAPTYDARQEEIEKYPEIPYIKDKEIRLTKGRYNTGKISTNLLDSIYYSASRVGVPFEIALGLAGRESTLGIGRGFKEGQGISPTELMSNWQQVQTIINPNSANDKINDLYEQYRQGIPISSEEFPFIKKYYDNERKEFESTRPITENPIDNALKYYIEGNYNKGDSRHTKMVEEDGRILMTEPAIQKWLSTKKAKGGKINRGKAANMAKNLFYDGGPTFSNDEIDAFASDNSWKYNFQDSNNNLLFQSKKAWNNAWKSENIGNSLTSIAGGLTDITQSTVANAKIKDTTGIQTAIDAAANTTFGGSTNEQLLAQYDAIEDLDRTSQRDLTGSVGSKLANTGKATLSGVQAGMQIGGPIGGIIGGAAGLISSGIGWIVGDTKAQNEAERLNREAEVAEQRRLANFDLSVNNLEQQNLMYDMANYAKYGGPLFNEFSNGITKINEGGSHEENPYDGVQVGVDNEGIPNLVEEGELILGPEITKDNSSFVMSDSTKVSRGIRTKYKLRDNITHADAAKEITKMSEEMPNDPIVRRTKDVQLQELMIDQEQVKMKKDKNKRKNKFAKGGIMSPLEYIGPTRDLVHAIQSMGIKPDYTPLTAYDDAIKATNIKVDSSPVKPNIEYTPFDTRSPLIEISANRAATNRALMNTSGANPAIARAALTNADYNYNTQLGKLWRSIEEAECNRQLGFEQFRTNLEEANRARDLQVQSTNAEILNRQAALRGDYANRQLAIDNATSAVISGNIDAAKQSLAGLARQSTYANWIKMLQDNNVLIGPDGSMIKLKKEAKNGGKIKRIRRLS